MRITSSLTALLLASSSLLAVACDDDNDRYVTPRPGDPLTFKYHGQNVRERALGAGLGVDAILAGFAIGFLPLAAQASGCPTITQDGDTTILTGDCRVDNTPDSDSDDDWTFYYGVARVTNMGIDADPSKPQRLEADQFGITNGDNGKMEFDGSVRYFDGVQHINLTAKVRDVPIHTRMILTCVDDVCTPDAAATVEIDGLIATIAGSWKLNVEVGAPVGQIALEGTDLIELDFADTVDGCTTYTLDGEPAGWICDPGAAE